ncbi:hypothetical protein HanXRQr2_Chr12g0537141 [Helianthus annuus]|uniref:Uncharacterized protein n=1 Tax=Helianthus annuus TaxID=4232 RepID=A0A9K3HFV4_HELAN|nr:hypothetical protein HanXRQr2_Chr12g0537141 [Helianthus annuus]
MITNEKDMQVLGVGVITFWMYLTLCITVSSSLVQYFLDSKIITFIVILTCSCYIMRIILFHKSLSLIC